MTKGNGKHLTRENREVIEEGINEQCSASRIAKRLGVSTSTVTREVMANRAVRELKAPSPATRLSARCIHYLDCEAYGSACEKCVLKMTKCKTCRTKGCIKTCPDYKRKMCPITSKWPYVCPPSCRKRAHCGYPKCSYHATDADEASRKRLVESREGIGITQEELSSLDNLISPLVRQGQSFEAIWATHAEELPVGCRCAYNYQEAGILSTAHVDLPRKARIKIRKKSKVCRGRDRVDRTSRAYDDFDKLDLALKSRVVQCDSVEGYSWNRQDILTLHFAARVFQLYLLKEHGNAQATVACLDAIEKMIGSREGFEFALPILLCDRGIEFDDWAGMERSVLEEGKTRCRVFYCDPMESNQKSQAERNHEQLRRILPKRQSDFDVLSPWDMATCTSHVNSYPLAGHGGRCAFDMLGDLLPQDLLEQLGINRVLPDKVVLRPTLLPHAVRTEKAR